MIDLGNVNDVEGLLPLLAALHGESVYATVPLEPDRLRKYLIYCLQDPNHVTYLHRRATGDIGGFLVGNVRPYFFSSELAAWDDFVYLCPDLRGGVIAYRLWKAFHDWACSRGAKQLWMGTSTGIDQERTRAFYEGLGHRQVGALYHLMLPAPRPKA